MSLSPLQKSLLASASVGSVIFGVSTIPLAANSSLPVEVKVRNQPVFEDEMNALAGPYLGVAGTVSIAVGIGILGMSGWRSAASHSESEKVKRSELEKNLLACKAELERIKFSDARLQNEKLGDFLQPEPARALQQHQTVPSQQMPQGMPSQSYAVIQDQQYVVHQPAASVQSPTASPNPTKLGGSHAFTREMQVAQVPEHSSRSHLYTTNAQVAQNLGAASIGHQPHAAQSTLANHVLEVDSDPNMQAMVRQLHDLMARVESLQAEKTGQMAA
jgi:hypothetical protein